MAYTKNVIFEGWRVEDEYSSAIYRESQGIFAASNRWVRLNPCNPHQQEVLLAEVKSHLDWKNRLPTPFISVYSDFEHASAEAERRAQDRSNVIIYHLVISEDDQRRYGPIHFRKVRKLVKRTLQSHIPDSVGRNEFIFLHHIPEEVIKDLLFVEGN